MLCLGLEWELYEMRMPWKNHWLMVLHHTDQFMPSQDVSTWLLNGQYVLALKVCIIVCACACACACVCVCVCICVCMCMFM